MSDSNDPKAKPKAILRGPRGRLVKGTAPVNPRGNPIGIERRLRELIAHEIKDWDGRSLDGWERMGLMMFNIAMGQRPEGQGDMVITTKDRMEAVKFLFDRVHGKAKILVESEATLHLGRLDVDVDALDDAALDALEAHVSLLASRTGAIVDAELVDEDDLDEDDE